jgi:hypothetical protein
MHYWIDSISEKDSMIGEVIATREVPHATALVGRDAL